MARSASKKLAKNTKAVVSQSKKQAKTIKRTTRVAVKQAKSIAKSLRDAFGRFKAKAYRNDQGKFVKREEATKTFSGKKIKPKKSPAPVTASRKVVEGSDSGNVIGKQRGSGRVPRNDPFADGRSYIIRKAPLSKGKTWAERINSIEQNEEYYDSLLGPGEYWIASVYGNRTKVLYGNIANLLDKLNEYVDKASEKDQRGLIANIQIMKFRGTPSKYAGEREKIVKNREKRKVDVKRKAAKSVGGGTDKLTKKKKTSIDLLDELTKQNEELKRQIAQLTSQKKASKKKAAKKTPKKAAKKTTKRK